MFYDAIKRIIDIILSIILIIVFSPILLFIPILIKLDSPGPVFADIPERVGKHKKPFHMYKFRSMIANAHKVLRTDPNFRRLYQEYKKHSYKLKDDPRVTRMGKFLRRFDLDELPQVFNVLKGEMSIVGPRAYYPDELKEQQRVYPETKAAIKKILTAKPGISGLWQVTGRSEVNFDKRVKIDLSYVENQSVLQDLIILAKTPWAMLLKKEVL